MIALPTHRPYEENSEGQDSLIKALIVDDSNLDRLILQKMLMKQGYDVYIASDGHLAIEMFEECQPDVVFMDLYLPETSGYEITKKIKKKSQQRYVPVIFVTAATDDTALERCLNIGGDDFIVKPIKESLLKAKVNSLLRIKRMHDQLVVEKEVIANYLKNQTKDMHDANLIIDNIKDPLFYNPGNIKYLLRPQYIISGDMFCSAVGPSGKHVLMAGDNTGHGLPAAIGSLIMYEVFYTMVKKGFEMENLIEEINTKLCRLLPSGRFFSACFVEIDEEYQTAKSWNAGMPDILFCDREGDIKRTVSSMHMPLGIKLLEEGEIKPDTYDIDNETRIYVYSDGITDTFNKQNEIFGEQRLHKALSTSEPDEQFENVIKSMEQFRNWHDQTDDVLFIEVNCDKSIVNIEKAEQGQKKNINPMDWEFSIELCTEALKHANPIPIIIQAISDLQGMEMHREKLFMILSEMYSNALEHGILKLDSAMKQEDNGFANYYQERQTRLEALEQGKVKINLINRVENNKGIMSLEIRDSGNGFDYENINTDLKNNGTRAGRGMALMKKMCRKFEYCHDGSVLNVEYEWDN